MNDFKKQKQCPIFLYFKTLEFCPNSITITICSVRTFSYGGLQRAQGKNLTKAQEFFSKPPQKFDVKNLHFTANPALPDAVSSNPIFNCYRKAVKNKLDAELAVIVVSGIKCSIAED